MKKHSYFTIVFLMLTMLSHSSFAQERLTSRFLYFGNDPQCSAWPSFGWESKFVTANRGVLRYASDKHLFYKYTPSFKGLSGNAEVFIYKYKSDSTFDNKVFVEILHAGKKDTMYLDLNTKKDQWVSIGKFNFNGDGKEFVRFTRLQDSRNGVITPLLPIRFDLYYHTKTRNLSAEELSANLSIGLSTKGNWSELKNKGYRPQYATRLSKNKGDEALWNPGFAMQGKINIYLYQPNIKSKDIYSIAHNGKLDQIQLKDIAFANLDLFNPITKQGWYKLGEFDFAGKGNEYLKVLKQANDSTLVDCMMLERVNLEGTLLDRTIVTPNQFNDSFTKNNQQISLEDKIKATQQVVGIYPNSNGESVVTSSKNGSTIYSRALYSREKAPHFIFNPCIIEEGDYDIYYFPYFLPNAGGVFEVNANQKTLKKAVKSDQFIAQQQFYVGNYTFSGNKTDEYVIMKGINRASDMTFEKKKADGAVLQQVVVTAHPYFVTYVYQDTKDLPVKYELGEMVRRGFVKPINESYFGVNQKISFKECLFSIKIMLDTANVKYGDTALLYQLPTTKNNTVTADELAQLMLNAMELSGRYANVNNYFRNKPEVVLASYKNISGLQHQEAFAKMLETRVFKINNITPFVANLPLNKKQVTLYLKEFYEQILCSGPPQRADWKVSFFDEFDGDQINWDKWIADDAVRFVGVSAKWKENCVVEDGLFKGYNYMDNHAVPYSSGNLHTNYRQTYGFFESRYRYPDRAYGSHSSFWTSSKGGDFNYNEGTYPNNVSNNNYFMRSGTNFHDYATKTNLAHDFHTFSGYLNDNDLFYGMDGKITWEVKDYPQFYGKKDEVYSAFDKSTAYPYNAMISTVVTYFDGPLDRDRIDGSYMACDWVRLYKEEKWLPAVDLLTSINDNEWSLKFNKLMDTQTINNSTLIVKCKNTNVPSFKVVQINAMRYKIVFDRPLDLNQKYQLIINSQAKDLLGNSLKEENTLFFKR